MKALLEETSTQKHAPVFHHCLKISRDDDDIRASFQHLCLDGEFFDLLSVETKITKNRVFLVIFKHKDAPLPPLPSTPAPRLPSLVCADSQPASSGSLSPWKQGWERDWWWEQQSPVNHVCSCVHQTDTHRERDYTSTVLFCLFFFSILFYFIQWLKKTVDRLSWWDKQMTIRNTIFAIDRWFGPWHAESETHSSWRSYSHTLKLNNSLSGGRKCQYESWAPFLTVFDIWLKYAFINVHRLNELFTEFHIRENWKKYHSCHEQMLSWSVEKLLSEMRTRLWWCCCKYVTETGPHVNQSLLL